MCKSVSVNVTHSLVLRGTDTHTHVCTNNRLLLSINEANPGLPWLTTLLGSHWQGNAHI